MIFNWDKGISCKCYGILLNWFVDCQVPSMVVAADYI